MVAEITSHSGRELGNVSMVAGEGEVLFKPGTQFKVLPGSGKQASDGYYVENWQETGEPPKQKEDDEKMPPLKFITGNLAGGLPVSSGGLDTESDKFVTAFFIKGMFQFTFSNNQGDFICVSSNAAPSSR